MNILSGIFYYISNIGVDNDNTVLLNKRIKTINKSALLGLLIQNSHIIFNIIIGNYFLAIMNFVSSTIFYFVWLFNYTRKYNLSIFLLLGVLPIGLIPFNYLLGDVGSENLLFSLIILSYYIFEENKKRILVTIFISIIYICIKILLNEEIGYYLFPELTSWFYYANIFYSLLSLALISDIYTRENQIHLDVLQVMNKSLSDQNVFINNLMKELNHRVKNNLQMVSSLFSLQAKKTENKEIKQELQDARDRVITIAMVHRKLYTTNSEMSIEIKGYISDLCSYLLQSCGKNDLEIMAYDLDNIELVVEDAVHIGLIINELMTNSIKYGLSNKHKKIEITLKKEENNRVLLTLQDSGIGFPKGMKIDGSDSFGYFLISAIIEQHDGEFKYFNRNGAYVEISLEMELQ